MRKSPTRRTATRPPLPRPFKRLLVALDTSEQAQYAVDAAARLARQLRAEVVLISVFYVARTSNARIEFIAQDVRRHCIDNGQKLLKAAKSRMPNPESVQIVLREGDAATEIVRAASVYDIDLILMGTHAKGRIAKALLGSVASAVVQRAPCPVLTLAHPLRPLHESAAEPASALSG